MRTIYATGIALIAAIALAACGEGNVFSLEVGDCFQDPGTEDEISNVEIVDCAEPHDSEVYALFDLDDGDFPGEDSVNNSAFQGCFLSFEEYVGRDYESSQLDYTWLVPSASSWGSGDREVVCVLYDLDGAKLTDSMKDSGV